MKRKLSLPCIAKGISADISLESIDTKSLADESALQAVVEARCNELVEKSIDLYEAYSTIAGGASCKFDRAEVMKGFDLKGTHKRRSAVNFLLVLFSCLITCGCTYTVHWQEQPVVRHLGSIYTSRELQCSIRIPENWSLNHNAPHRLYTASQWTDLFDYTGIGIVHAENPLPFSISPDFVVDMAKQQYTSSGGQGKVIGVWTDPQGRRWFEAENNKYHVRGYAVTHGRKAWIVYAGYRTTHYKPEDFDIAVESIKTFEKER